jgi:predicted aspartyl protease
MGATEVAVRFEQESIVLPVSVNGRLLEMVMDTGDAIGPTYTAADAQALGLVKGAVMGIEGAGGASSVYQTTATVSIGSLTFVNEPGAIDGDLTGSSLIGFPFFAARCARVEIDIARSALVLIGA